VLVISALNFSELLIKGVNRMKNSKVKADSTVSAVRTHEGFIEITSLELLDNMVGGLISPDAIFCQLSDEEARTANREQTAIAI
jgi:hypothetical protein